MTLLELAQKAIATLDNKKADGLRVLGIRELSVLADCFVLATGTSSMYIKALADELEFQLKEAGIMPDHVKEYRFNSWILLDYGHAAIYVLIAKTHRLYDLDRP